MPTDRLPLKKNKVNFNIKHHKFLNKNKFFSGFIEHKQFFKEVAAADTDMLYVCLRTRY